MTLLNSLVEPLGWTLLHFVWQGLVIGVAHEIALRAAHRQTPRLRYGISLIAMLMLVLAPTATFLAMSADPVQTLAATSLTPAGTAPSIASAAASPGATGFAAVIEAGLPYVVIAWLMGVVLLSARFGAGVLALRTLARQADYDAISDWVRDELGRLIKQMGITRTVRIALSTRVGSPLVIGWLRPVILLPLSAATGLDHQQIRMVLAHELAHLRRYDHLVNLLQVAVETLLFYHPAVHRVSKSLRQEREQCCDDMAAAIGGNRLAYARVLAELETLRQHERSRVLALGIADQELYVRIERLVGGASGEGSRQRWAPVVLIALAGLISTSHTLDFDAPLLPSLFGASNTPQRVALQLPHPVTRQFVPIAGSGPESIPESVPQSVPQAAEKSVETFATTREDSGDAPAAKAAATQNNVAEMRTVPDKNAPARNATEVSHDPARDNTVLERRGATPAMTETTVAEIVQAGGELLHSLEPEYPRHALRRGKEGFVELAFTITAEGEVADATVLNAEPRGFFEHAALAAIKQWKYSPFTEDGVAIPKRVSQVMEFRLSDQPAQRGGTTGSRECREQTGTRLCRAAEAAGTQLTVLSD